MPALLAGLNLMPPLEFALVSSVERCEKPEPRIFERALELAGVTPSEALHAGNDLENDARAARAVGMRSALVEHGSPIATREFPVLRDLFALRQYVAELA